MINPIQTAVVVAQDGANHGVFVLLEGPGGAGQGVAGPIGVQVGTSGPRDAVRIKADALPTRGTRGVVLFPRGDVRNGVWLCAFGATLNDASPFVAANPNDDYEALWSGTWRIDLEDGTHATVLPDGTSFVIGPAAPTVPIVVRHVVDPIQDPPRVPVPFAQAQRVASTPSPFPAWLSHATGACADVSAEGDITASAASGRTFTAQANGGSVVIDPSGDVTASAAAGAVLTCQANSGIIVIDASGNITLTGAGGAVVQLRGADVNLNP